MWMISECKSSFIKTVLVANLFALWSSVIVEVKNRHQSQITTTVTRFWFWSFRECSRILSCNERGPSWWPCLRRTSVSIKTERETRNLRLWTFDYKHGDNDRKLFENSNFVIPLILWVFLFSFAFGMKNFCIFRLRIEQSNRLTNCIVGGEPRQVCIRVSRRLLHFWRGSDAN